MWLNICCFLFLIIPACSNGPVPPANSISLDFWTSEDAAPRTIPIWLGMCNPLFELPSVQSNVGDVGYSGRIVSCNATSITLTVYRKNLEDSPENPCTDEQRSRFNPTNVTLSINSSSTTMPRFGSSIQSFVRLGAPPTCAFVDPATVFLLETFVKESSTPPRDMCTSDTIASRSTLALGNCLRNGFRGDDDVFNASVELRETLGVVVTPYKQGDTGCSSPLSALPLLPLNRSCINTSQINPGEKTLYTSYRLLPANIFSFSFTPSPSPASSPNPSSLASTFFTLPVIIGISIGAPVAILILVLLSLHLRKKRTNLTKSDATSDNVIVSNVLRPSIYRPTVKTTTPLEFPRWSTPWSVN